MCLANFYNGFNGAKWTDREGDVAHWKISPTAYASIQGSRPADPNWVTEISLFPHLNLTRRSR